MFKFHSLEVYQKAKSLYIDSLEIIERKDLSVVLKDQLNRAQLSVVLNIAEGSGRMTARDQNRFYTIARASVAECAAVFDVLYTIERITEVEYLGKLENLNKMSFMLYRLIKSKR